MAKTYRCGPVHRAVNAVLAPMTRLGLGSHYRYVLTVQGRKSGTSHSTPVDVVDVGGERWLVAPYGVTNWVRNARAAGTVGLRRGSRAATFGVEEATVTEAVPVMREYMRCVPITRAYWECQANSSDLDIAAQASNHPVFRLVAMSS
jgi:deazaflavin-dependent oxidoreductase (nitroreductase family)